LWIALKDINKNEQRKESRVRDLLPFWARELLTMKDEAEGKNKVREPLAKEGF
jgi:hypothetical protein